MKVAHIITSLETGGAETMLTRIVEQGGGMEHVAVVSLGDAGALAGQIARAGVPVFALGMRPGRPNPGALWRLIRLLRRLKPDVVQTWLYHADFAGLLAASLARHPLVVWNVRCAELDPADHPRSLMVLLKLLARLSHRPAAIVTNSEAGRRAHDALGYRPRAWAVIPNGFNIERFAPDDAAAGELRRELGVDPGTPLVGLLARHHPMKDHATFLKAAGRALALDPDRRVHFVAAGRGVDTDPGLRSLARELAVGTRLTLLPERSDAPRFLAALDVAVSSSYGEAFPNVVGEAMACGTPCVVTDVGDSAAVVAGCGVVVPPREPGALAAGIITLLDLDEPARRRLRARARERVVSHFSIAAAAARYRELYSHLMAQAR